jgi:curved DNA-binding protein CbpA
MTMTDRPFVDLYDVLQVSPSAEPDTIHRVYRLLAQRWHPDNPRTGNVAQFHAIHEAYVVLSDPLKRAQYDLSYAEGRQNRWRVLFAEPRAGSNFEAEQNVRLTVLEILYAHRRAEPRDPGIFVVDLEGLTGTAREHLEFTMWYLLQKGFVLRSDNSRVTITADGVDYLEANHQEHLIRRRIAATSAAA